MPLAVGATANVTGVGVVAEGGTEDTGDEVPLAVGATVNVTGVDVVAEGGTVDKGLPIATATSAEYKIATQSTARAHRQTQSQHAASRHQSLVSGCTLTCQFRQTNRTTANTYPVECPRQCWHYVSLLVRAQSHGCQSAGVKALSVTHGRAWPSPARQDWTGMRIRIRPHLHQYYL